MIKAMVVRAGSGWGKALIKQLIGSNVEVIAYSGSKQKLKALEETFSSSSLLRTVRGDTGNLRELLAAAEGVDMIFCGTYLTYDDKPDKVRRMLEAVRGVSALTGARTVVLEGVYFPADENPSSPSEASMRIMIPELFGEGVSNTIIHYALRKIIQGKPIKRLTDPSVRRDYLYVEDAARYVQELAIAESAYGKNWRLRSNDQISQNELLDMAGSVIHRAPLIESSGGWQLRLLRWYESRAESMLHQYEQVSANKKVKFIEFCGPITTPYQESIASTVKHMARKLQGGVLFD
ncbi:hypothetical protein PghCCS26_22260 [Paenibacillus glycanilyticus]|uniref:NAD-dependent epimerase/dehydratase domain-containing protein n=1 Tax=Paenibacillus glycanilyticus TaxID=126569 RepID=A0ABQ6NKL0_9BACL|nr:NAD-dependent epimerase/dehydratase family protein [Paenibacillus glycanilyticus]GMK45098.1 hypothetical protein PghCCS26_22260 [Paenibacillus glycanilyticus]